LKLQGHGRHRHHGRRVRPPQRPEHKPGAAFLGWHGREVFKGAARHLCEDEKTATKPLDRKPTVALDKIMGLVAAGAADADLVSTLAARLARLEGQKEALGHVVF
jgi:hypothetical protein